MNNLRKETDVLLHWMMACIGGFMGAYSIMLHAGNFGSATTGNMVLLTRNLEDGEYITVLIRIGAFLMFCAGVAVSYLLTQFTKLNMKITAIIVDAIGLLLIDMLPISADLVLTLYPFFFCTAFQWGVFSGAAGYSSATIFISNNTKQTVLAGLDYLITKKGKAKEKFLFFGWTILSYTIGALIGVFAVNHFEVNGAVVGIVLLLIPMLVTVCSGKRGMGNGKDHVSAEVLSKKEIQKKIAEMQQEINRLQKQLQK